MKGLNGFTTTSRTRAAATIGAAALTLLALALTGCGDAPAPPKMPGDPTPPAAQVSVRLSALTPEPSQGKVVLIDYEGPPFDESELRISLGGQAALATVADDQIGVLLPLSHSGSTPLAFDFGGDRSATMTLNIAMAPSIPDPRQYLETEINKLASALSELAAQESELRELSDALRVAQESLSALGEQEIAEVATLYKQNIGSSLDRPISSALLQTASLQAAAFDATMCDRAIQQWWGLHSVTTTASVIGGVFLNLKTPKTALVGTLIVGFNATNYPILIEHLVNVAAICLRPEVTQIFQPAHSIQTAQVGPAAALPRLSFRDGEPLAVTVTAAYRIQHDLRETFLNAMSKLRGQLLKFGTDVRPLCEHCAAWLHRQADRIPQSVEKEAAVPASGFVLKGVSNADVAGRISGVDGDRLSLTFTVAEAYVPETDDYIDFDFVLANSSIGLDDTPIPGRVIVDPKPTFDATVSDQTYERGAAIAPLVLPAASGGSGSLTHSLTPDVPGLRFEPQTRTLSGTPTTTGTYNMTYTATDVERRSGTLSFMIEVTEAQQPPSTFDEGPIVRFYTWETPVNVVLPTVSGRTDPLVYSLMFNDGTGAYRGAHDGLGLRYDSTRRAIVGAVSKGGFSRVISPFLYLARTLDGDIADKVFGAIFVMDESRLQQCGCNTLGCLDWSSDSSDTCYFYTPSNTEPSFQGQSIPPQNYKRDVQIWTIFPGETRTGDRPQTFSLKPDVPGLRFEPPIRALGPGQGQLRGTPTTAGTYSMTYTVTDVDGDSDTLYFTIEVSENEVPSFHESVRFSHGLHTFERSVPIAPLMLPEATGGDPPLTYGLTPGIPGLRFDAGVRTLTGTPTTAGTYTMTYTVTDVDGDSDTLYFTIEVSEDAVPSFHASVSRYAFEKGTRIAPLVLPEATGGDPPLTYGLIPGVPGLQFDAGVRTLTGTPTTAGTYPVTYWVTDVDGDSDTLYFTIEVSEDAVPSFHASVSRYAFEKGTRIAPLVLPEATGGDPPLTYGLIPGIPGLRFDAGVRTLTGTPTTAGTYPMTYTVTDEDGDEDSLVFTIEITSPADRTAETRHYMIYNLSAEPSLKDEVSTSCTPLPSSNWAAGSVTGEEQKFQEYRDSLWSRLGCGCCCVAKFASSAARQRSYGAIALSYSFDIPVANNYCFAGSGVGATLEEARSAALTECRENGFSSSCRIVHEKYVPPTGGS